MKIECVSSRVNEVVGRRVNELVHQHGKEQTDQNNRLLRKARSDRGLKRGPYVTALEPKEPRAPRVPRVVGPKGKPGRPLVYKGMVLKMFEECIRQYGLKGAERVLTERGRKVSQIVLRKVAAKAGITFKRGRPKAKAA